MSARTNVHSGVRIANNERPLRVKLRKARNERMFSAQSPMTDTIRDGMDRLASNGPAGFVTFVGFPYQ